MRTIKAVIFDLDGILVDTSKFHAKAWADLVRSVGIEPPPDLEERVKGISRLASLKIALGARAADFSDAELHALAERKNLPDAIRFANAAAALSVTRLGAQPSAPTRAAIERCLRRNK